jgi:hypothetical protein
MFPSSAFQETWLRRQAKVLGGCAPQILEKTLHALTLLGHLQEIGLPLTFRGGTSLLLHLPQIHRLSVDIDIVCPVEGAELEKMLADAAKRPPFTGFKESERDGARLPRRRHFKFFYPSAINVQEYEPPNVILDVVAETEAIHVLEQKPITTGFLPAEREIKVQLPTVNSLLGDKLTAFAPRTTGVLYVKKNKNEAGVEIESPGDLVQIVKQLFDVGVLFDVANNGAEVADTYRRSQAKESGYRGGGISPEATLDDTLKACASATPFKPAQQARFPDYALLKRGYTGVQGHVTQRFNEDAFRRSAARTAALAAHLRTNTLIDFEALRYRATAEQDAAIKACSFNNTSWDWLDGMKQVNPAAYFHWMIARRLLGT